MVTVERNAHGRYEFKAWTMLFTLHIAPITLQWYDSSNSPLAMGK